MRSNCLPHHHSITEIADIFQVPETHIRHILAKHLEPSWWVWRNHWREPRFPDSSIPEWSRLLEALPAGCFEGEPPKLERPAQVFRQSRLREPTKEEVEAFLRCFPPKERERLRRTNI